MQGPKKSRLGRLMGSVAGGAALLFAAGAAQAQDANTNTTSADQAQGSDVIVVQGFRASLRNSANVKRSSSSIVEAVTAEEIGKLPDNSIAESLARLPGLSSQRLFGRAQVISVRGLSPDFSTALLNGREQVSAGDNRGVEFDQYPSELLTSVVVYKTPDAALIGQGLAGTADMRTVRPLSYADRVFSASVRYEWDDLGQLTEGADDNGYRYTLSYIDHSADGVWGWALGAAILNSPTQAERWEAWGYPTGDGSHPTGDPVGSDTLVLGGAKPYVQSSELDRNGYMGVLQYRPSDTFQSTLDIFYSEFSEDQHLRGIELPLWWDCSVSCGQDLQTGWTAENGLVTSGAFTDVEGVVRNDFRGRDATVKAVGWNSQLNVGGWTFAADLSYSEAVRHDIDLETYAGSASGGDTGASDTLGFQQGGGGGFHFTHVLDYSDPTLFMLTDPAGWGQAGYLKKPETTDELDALRLSATRDFSGPISQMEFGVDYSERQKTKRSDEWFVQLAGSPTGNITPIPSNLLLAPTQLDFLGLGPMVSYDPLAAIAAGVYTLVPQEHTDVVAKDWNVVEHVAVLYAKFGLDTHAFGMPLTGNFGLQGVHTSQSSFALSSIGSGGSLDVVPRTGGDDYWEWLPSVNLVFEPSDNQRLRVGIARTLARARMDEERASFQFNWNVSPSTITNTDPTSNNSYWSGNGGNPELKPWIADGLDISYEYYFGGAGYISAAVFYKYLESYIYPQNALFDFTGYPISPAIDPNTNLPYGAPSIFEGVVSTSQNGNGGNVEGIELTASLPGEVIAPWLDGFGLLINGSYTESSIHPPNTPGTELPGLSKNVVNTTLYYEHGGFEVRVSDRYRSNFLGEVTGFGANRTLRDVKGESVIDAQIGYRFQDGPMQGLSFQLQGNNLTDEPFTTFANGDERQILDYQRYGRVFLFGVSYRR